MKKPRSVSVYLTSKIPGAGMDLVRQHPRVRFSMHAGEEIISRRELLKRVRGKQVVWTLITDKIDKAFFDAAGPQLKLIAQYATGFDNIDLDLARRRDVRVTNAPSDVQSEAVAELTISLIFAVARRLIEADSFTRAGKYHGWKPGLFPGMGLRGKTLGIVGGGRIGTLVAEHLHRGFDMKVLYHDIVQNPELERTCSTRRSRLETVLKQADVVSVHVPLFPSTRHLIGAREIHLMKKTAILVNTARGPVVDEVALTHALAKGQIAGAGLDVFECEPLIDCNPNDTLELRKLPNVVLTPHIGSATHEARNAMGIVSAKNIIRFVEGKRLLNPIV